MSQYRKISLQFREFCFYLIFSIVEFFFVIKFLFGKNNQFQIQPSQILVVCLDNIGDLLFTTPIVSGLRKKYPDAKITIMTDSKRLDIYQGNLSINANIHIDPNKKRLVVLRDLFHIFKNLPKHDLHIILEKNELFSRFILFVLMFYNAKNIIWCLTNLPYYYNLLDYKFIKNRNPNIYIVDFYSELLKNIGIEIKSSGLSLYYSKEDIDHVSSYMRKVNLKESEFISICPFARYYGQFIKTMTEEQLLLLLQKLVITFPFQNICILGDKSCKSSTALIIKCLNINNIINTCGNFTVNQLAVFLNQSKFLITVDTGVMHIGVSQKSNIISLFGPTKKEQLIPFEYWNNVVEAINEGSGGVSTYAPIPKRFSNLKNDFDLNEILFKAQQINKKLGKNE